MAAAGASQLLLVGNSPHHSQLGSSSTQSRMSLREEESTKSAAKLERERDRALASIAFMEREQDRVLRGLHQEIAALTQRCSDLQFQLTMQERAAKVEEELRAHLTEIELVVEEERRGRNEANDALVELVAKREELEATLAWERLEWKNRAEGLEARLGEKEDTIEKLKGELVMQASVAKLQAQVKQIYTDSSAQAHSSLIEVARKARSPGQSGPTSLSPSLPPSSSSPLNGRTSGPSSLPSLASPPSSLLLKNAPSLPITATVLSSDPAKEVRRSKVFRHHLRLEGDLGGGSLYSHASPPVLAIERRSVLPADYKATLPTLPHITRRQERSVAGSDVLGERCRRQEQGGAAEVSSRCLTVEEQAGGPEVLAVPPPLSRSPWGLGEGSAC